ncbi:DUF4350 domain-containing protein [Nonlabens sp.]|uniref:DUF4350 domain-containing protein n=1 Tax=Nonlabens sp. TaxID=1888209 RepID=UPI003F6A06BE
MDKRARNIGLLLLVLLVMLFSIEQMIPKPINWRTSYTSGDKIPYGAYVLYDQLDELFPESKIELVNTDPMTFLKRNQEEKNANYIFINDYLRFDEVEADYLMDFAARGNKIFIATTTAYGPLADTLNLETSYSYYADQGDTVRVRLINKSFKDRSYVYVKGSEYKYIESYDTLNTKVLGEILPFEPYEGFIEEIIGDDLEEDAAAEETLIEPEEVEETSEEYDYEDGEYYDEEDLDVAFVRAQNRKIPQVNFIETKVGDGAIYFNLNPIAFTNYYMLQDGKQQYVSEVLSYLNEGPIYFDDYGKSGRRVVTSPMRYVLTQDALKWAYYIATVCVLLYFFFAGKRQQRIVPVVEPLENSSVEFTKTIGQLFYQSGDINAVVDKKINYFLERLRSRYFVNTENLDAVFIKRLAVKSGKSQNFTEDVILYINKLRSQPVNNEYELKQLNKRIEAFLKE